MQHNPDVNMHQLRWLLGLYVALSIATVALSVFMDDLLFFFTAALPLCLMWFSVTAWSVVLFIRFVRRRAFGLGLLSIAFPFALVWTADDARDLAHFTVMRPYYDSQVSRLPKNGARYEEFNWGGLLFASRGVVYDETDQIELPRGWQSAAWIARLKNTDLLCGDIRFLGPVRPISGHYYLTSFGC